MKSQYDVEVILQFVQASVTQNSTFISMFQAFRKKIPKKLWDQALEQLVKISQQTKLSEGDQQKLRHQKNFLKNFDSYFNKFKKQNQKLFNQCEERKQLYDIQSQHQNVMQCSFCDQYHENIIYRNPQSCPNFVKNWSK